MKPSSLAVLAVLWLGLWTTSCSKDDKLAEGGSSASASAAATQNDNVGEVKKVCLKLCDKTVDCAAELAGDGVDEAAAKRDAKQGLGDCKTKCETSEVTARDRAQVGPIAKCLTTDCGQFVDCVASAGPAK